MAVGAFHIFKGQPADHGRPLVHRIGLPGLHIPGLAVRIAEIKSIYYIINRVKWFVKEYCTKSALTHKFNFIFLSYKNITFLTAFSWFSESQGIVSP